MVLPLLPLLATAVLFLLMDLRLRQTATSPFFPCLSCYLLDDGHAPVSSDDGDAAVPTERYLSVTDSDLSSPPQTSSDLLDGALVLATDSDCGALSTEESASRTDYNLSFPLFVCSQQNTTANELSNDHLQKGDLIMIDQGSDTKDSEQLKIHLSSMLVLSEQKKRELQSVILLLTMLLTLCV